MKPVELQELLVTLREFGVTRYESTELRLELMPKQAELPQSLKDAVSAKLTDDELLFNPMKGFESEVTP